MKSEFKTNSKFIAVLIEGNSVRENEEDID
jgi:hypothetical protein